MTSSDSKEEYRRRLEHAREIAWELRTSLADFGGMKDEVTSLDEERASLDTYLIVVVGDHNAGKSSTINALLGKNVLDTDHFRRTEKITIVHRGKDGEPPLVHSHQR